MTQATAPGKAILFGEHAVVYDQPAVAIPLSELRTAVTVQDKPGTETPSIYINAKDIHESYWLYERDNKDPLAYAARLALDAMDVHLEHSLELIIESDIPVASGLGSGAATSVAIIRALAYRFNAALENEQVSEIAFKVEQLHHGTPSGIDNTVIAFETPLYYVRKQVHRPISLGNPLYMVLGHCGVSSHTATVVNALRERMLANPEPHRALFKQIGTLVEQGFLALKSGDVELIGTLMDTNHGYLQELGVSIDPLDKLVAAARSAGALGAKLSGAGAGGFMIAAVSETTTEVVAEALRDAGALHTLTTQVRS